MVGLSRQATAALAASFQTRQVHKLYIAAVSTSDMRPTTAATGTLDDTTHFVLAATSRLTWVALKPHTGRKHQLRQYCAQILGTPIVGDRTYGSPMRDLPLHLHARSIMFPHPISSGVIVSATSPLEPHFLRSGCTPTIQQRADDWFSEGAVDCEL